PSTNTIVVRVFDSGTPSLSATQSFKVIVNEVNSPPILNPIIDQTVNELATLNVTPVASDADIPGQTLTFTLVSGPSGVNLNGSSGALSWTPTAAQGPSTNTIVVRVFDNGTPSLSATQSFRVFVNEVSSTPTLNPIADQTVNELATLNVTNVANDTDIPVQTLTFALVSGPSGVSLNETTGVLTWTPTEAQGPSTNLIVVRVFDNGTPSLSATQSFKVFVDEVNSPPTLNPIADQTIAELTTLNVTNVAGDMDMPAQTLTFALVNGPSGVNLDDATGVLTWTPTSSQGPSTNTIVVRVFDNGTPSLSATQSFTVVVSESNRAPLFHPINPLSITEGSLLTFMATATDADLPPQVLRYNLEPGAPATASVVETNGLFSWIPPVGSAPSTNVVVIRVTDDGTPEMSDRLAVTIMVIAPPRLAISVSQAGLVTLGWNSLPGQVYRVEYSDDNPSGLWSPLGEDVVAEATLTTTGDQTRFSPNRIYRVRLVD
ncbi:MAG TPA: putative Ig domain-containing protein, partial [Verrucomicrobiae bacterium]|nr:putative Ig domain-containing protein [Verrucomicrobiae bacterium]